MSSFKTDAIDWFSGSRGGHMEKYLYSDHQRETRSGSQLWHDFLKANPHYYILQNEISLIDKAIKKLDRLLTKADTVIDFGVGDDAAIRKKIFPFFNAFTNLKKYVGIDLSSEFLQHAQQTISNEFQKLDVQTINADFFADNFSLPGNKRFGLIFGSTVSNLEMLEGESFPRRHIVASLQHLKDIIGGENHILVTYDANQNQGSALKAYDNAYMPKIITGVMYDIAKITDGGFSPESWSHEMTWDERSHVIHQCVIATKHQEFSIGRNDFTVKKGQRFVAVNLFKFSTSVFQTMCEEAGFSVGQSFSDNENKMQLQHLSV